MSSNNTSVTTTEFKTSVSCLRAVSSALEMETSSMKIKARCVEK
jgi:hypothetical protein